MLISKHLACISCSSRQSCTAVLAVISVIVLMVGYWSRPVPHSVRIDLVQPTESFDGTIAVRNPSDVQTKTAARSHILYVVSLDGKITAMDVRQQGRQIWTANLGSTLIESTLSKFEMMRNSRSIRLVPSLIGGLYEKHEHTEHIEPFPFDAETLLNTSLHFHDGLVMTGGKDIDTLGLDLQTGKVVYRFAEHYVNQSTSTRDACAGPMLLVKRIRQTVRARSVRNGDEKWNFSVSNYELRHMHAPSSEETFEAVKTDRHHHMFFEYQLRTGVVLAFNPHNQLVWTSSVENPMAAVWELKNGRLKEKSLFKTRLSRRLAFIGEFDSTPYVIISPHIQRQLIHHAKRTLSELHSHPPGSVLNKQRPMLSSWYPYEQKHLLTMAFEWSAHDQKYPLIVRQSQLWDIKGYLQLMHPMEYTIDEENTEVPGPVHLGLGRRFYFFFVCLMVLMLTFTWYSIRKRQSFRPGQVANLPECPLPSTQPFQSRYILEYEHVRFLGRGGFGIVFEAINKLDQRRVAIKRVSLKRTANRERALKEIRCMAVLNHPNLVQYYYAWNECPPIGWEGEEDKQSEATKDSLNISGTELTNHAQSIGISPMIDFTFERSLNASQVAAADEDDASHSSLFEHSDQSSSDECTDDDGETPKQLSAQEDLQGSTTYFYFVMELCQSESLRDRLMKRSIDRPQAWSIFDQIVQGIEHIHSQKLIHRDLKPANILFSMDNIVKIGDFGLVSAFGESKIEYDGSDEPGGTMLYISPEQIIRQSYNQKVDIYAMGIILFELLYPFSTQMERIHALTKARLSAPIFPADFETNLPQCCLIRSLLSHSSHERPRASELRQDSVYQNILSDEGLF